MLVTAQEESYTAVFVNYCILTIPLPVKRWHRRDSSSCTAKNTAKLALDISSSIRSFSAIILGVIDMLVVVKLKPVTYETSVVAEKQALRSREVVASILAASRPAPCLLSIMLISDILPCLSSAYREVISFEPLSKHDSPGTRRAHGELLSSANMIIGQMYAHVQGIAAGSSLEEDKEPMTIDDGQGSWGESRIDR